MSSVQNNKFIILLKNVASVKTDIIETKLVTALNVKVINYTILKHSHVIVKMDIIKTKLVTASNAK